MNMFVHQNCFTSLDSGKLFITRYRTENSRQINVEPIVYCKQIEIDMLICFGESNRVYAITTGMCKYYLVSDITDHLRSLIKTDEDFVQVYPGRHSFSLRTKSKLLVINRNFFSFDQDPEDMDRDIHGYFNYDFSSRANTRRHQVIDLKGNLVGVFNNHPHYSLIYEKSIHIMNSWNGKETVFDIDTNSKIVDSVYAENRNTITILLSDSSIRYLEFDLDYGSKILLSKALDFPDLKVRKLMDDYPRRVIGTNGDYYNIDAENNKLVKKSLVRTMVVENAFRLYCLEAYISSNFVCIKVGRNKFPIYLTFPEGRRVVNIVLTNMNYYVVFVLDNNDIYQIYNPYLDENKSSNYQENLIRIKPIN